MRVARAVKRFGQSTVLDVEDLQFERGKAYAIIGSNGSGKTTLLRALAGQLVLDEGAVELASTENVGYMPQRSYAFYGTVTKNVRLGISQRSSDGQLQDGDVSFDAEAARLNAGDVMATEFSELAKLWRLPAQARMDALLKVLSIDGLASSNAKRLSGGETARMALARLLMGDYTHVLLDEPTAALDVTSTLVTERLVRTYLQARDAGAVVVTHSIKQAERLADEVLFMHEGHVVERGPASQVLVHPQTEELARFLEVAGS